MKTAILLCGNIRTFNRCKINILDTFSFLDPDYFVSTYTTLHQYHPCVKGAIGFYSEEIKDDIYIKTLFDGFNVKEFCIDSIEFANQHYRSIGGEDFNKQTGINYSSGYLQFWKIKRCLSLLEGYGEYDIVIKMRCDLLCNSENIRNIDYSNLKNCFYVNSSPTNYNDQIFISSQDNVAKINDFIVNNFFKYVSNVNGGAGETLLRIGLEDSGLEIKTFPLLDYIVRENDVLVSCC